MMNQFAPSLTTSKDVHGIMIGADALPSIVCDPGVVMVTALDVKSIFLIWKNFPGCPAAVGNAIVMAALVASASSTWFSSVGQKSVVVV